MTAKRKPTQTTPTMKAVAAAAGVSISTVSRCLNQPESVRVDKLEQVRDAIRKLGYSHPPPAHRRGPKVARENLSKKTLMFLWTEGDYAAHSDTGQFILHGIMSGLRRHGISMMVDRLDEASYIPHALEDGEIDGVFLHGAEPAPDLVDVLRKLPTLWIFQAGSPEWGDRIQPDHHQMGALASRHLLEAGATHLCCVTFRPALPPQYFTSRTEGFVQHAALAGAASCQTFETDEVSRIGSENAQSVAKDTVRKFLKLNPRPDGLFVAHDLDDAVCAELTRKGVQIGKDLHVVAGKSETQTYDELTDIPITRLVDVPEHFGLIATDMLLWRILHPRLPRVTHLIPGGILTP